jgi:Family of unknown function (DUF6011)
MTTPAALAAEYRRVIPAKFVTKRDGSPMLCMTCGKDLVMGQAFAATPGTGWHSYCATCASSTTAQIGGLVERIEALVTPLGENVPAPIVAAVEAATPLIEQALNTGEPTAFLVAKQALLAIRTQVGEAKRADRDANALDLSSVPAGMYAVPGGDTRLKVKIDKPTTGRWDGFVFVKDGAVYGEGQRYGMQKPGQAYQGKIEAELRIIAADPMAASAAYGHLTSTCGICRRPLEDAESVARGIGPICARKVGWA